MEALRRRGGRNELRSFFLAPSFFSLVLVLFFIDTIQTSSVSEGMSAGGSGEGWEWKPSVCLARDRKSPDGHEAAVNDTATLVCFSLEEHAFPPISSISSLYANDGGDGDDEASYMYVLRFDVIDQVQQTARVQNRTSAKRIVGEIGRGMKGCIERCDPKTTNERSSMHRSCSCIGVDVYVHLSNVCPACTSVSAGTIHSSANHSCMFLHTRPRCCSCVYSHYQICSQMQFGCVCL